MNENDHKERSILGLSRVLRSDRPDLPSHPSRGGSRGYDINKRNLVLDDVIATSLAEASEKHRISTSTIRRWMERVMPYRQTGNKPREDLVGLDQFLLCLAVHIYPRGSSDEIAAFIHRRGGSKVYSRATISKRCAELKLTRKKCSLEAYRAFTPRNLMIFRLFFSEPLPMGIRNVPRYQLCDTDEAKFCVMDFEKKIGRSYQAIRVRDGGHFSRSAPELNLIMTVEPGNPNLPAHMLGSLENPRKWWHISSESVEQGMFSEYIDHVVSDIEANPLPFGIDSRKIFLWDNLSVHGTALVHSTLEMRPTRATHRFVSMPRPPYQPKIPPIEYMFGEISTILARKCARNWGVEELYNELHNACMCVGLNGNLNRTFAHCGY